LKAKKLKTATSNTKDTGAPREKAVLILPLTDHGAVRDPDLRLAEAQGLAVALDLDVVSASTINLRRVHPNAFFGGGRIEALSESLRALDVGIVIVDASLTPVQQRNLERALQAKVIDRTGLILEIFARRARTREGRLQVELARLGYERSRLVRTWTHLERQRGGLGKTGGPGESQLEIDRRLIAKQIDRLKADIEDVRRTRGLQRRARRKAGYPTVALVGYTNAGKSTLFNRLTDAGVLAKDMPFATLDPTARLVRLASGRQIILSDTVGFITDLPTELVAAFRATLEEVSEADVLIHVRDIAHAESDGQRDDVIGVLDQILGAGQDRPAMIEAWNKADLLSPEKLDAMTRRLDAPHAPQDAPAVLISATSGAGVEVLLEALEPLAFGAMHISIHTLDPADGAARAQLAASGRILKEELDPQTGALRITLETPADRMPVLPQAAE
jgi:GTP-binding protein HflX